jgi:PAS domain S-box-containing protein
MYLTENPLFKSLFNTLIPRVILKVSNPEFDILNCNETFLALGTKVKEDVIGKSLFEVSGSEGINEEDITVIKDAFQEAILTNQALNTKPFKGNILSDISIRSESWFKLEILPVCETDEIPSLLFLSIIDCTAEVSKEQLFSDALQREIALTEQLADTKIILAKTNLDFISTAEELTVLQANLKEMTLHLETNISEHLKELNETESSLRSLVMNAHYPLMILRGRSWVIEIANQPLVNLWDKTIEHVTGARLMDILPEIEDQPFPKFLRQVYDSGVGYGQEEQIFHYESPTGPATKYVSFYYDPLLDNDNEVCGIIVSADDITEKVKARELLIESYQQQQALTEEFSAVNEELAVTVEELSSSNEELMVSRKNLESKHIELALSETRFSAIFKQAPIGICLIRASDLVVQEVNDGYLELVGKTREEMEHRTIWEAVSEVEESYAPVMMQVINTGIAFIAKEHKLLLLRKGVLEPLFIDFVYEPVFSALGEVHSIMVLGIDVTDKVMARHKIEDVEERIRLAVEAAEIGTFDYQYENDELIASERSIEIFDITVPLTRTAFLSKIHPEDFHLTEKAHASAVSTGKIFYEVRLIHSDDSIHWVRVQANVYFEVGQKPGRILGTIIDITDYKMLQQQKDDFISIASHELKTPITSLKASLQLLQRMKSNPTSPVFPKLVEQSNRSMNKISDLVDDLLNVSRMSNEQVTLTKTVFTISSMLNNCCSHVRMNGKHELVFQGDEALKVFADEHRIDQVVVNLVNNAVKYAPDSKEIFLIAEKLGDMAKITIKDTGPGIPTEKLQHLFDRYYRAEATGFNVSGLGLGLYICKEIIARHDGEIGVESEPGKGSSFWFTLPL